MRNIFYIFLFIACSAFADYNVYISEFDKNFINLNSKEQLKMHQQLKNLYIQSIIIENEEEKIEVLKRLIISSKALNLDDSNYASELLESGFSKDKINNLRKAFVKDIYIKDDKNEIENNTTRQKVENNKSKINTKKNQKEDNLTKAIFKKNDDEKIFVLNSIKEKDSVKLILNKKINSKDFKSFSLEDENNFRYISDFDGILENGKKTYEFDNAKIVISQYNPQTIRIVVYSKSKKNVYLTIKNENVNIYFKEEDNKIQQEYKQELEKEDKLYVLETIKLENGVKLQLSDDIKAKDIISFNVKDKDIFRKVFSFDGILENGKKTYYFGKNFITITQFNPQKVRVVLSSPNEIKFDQQIIEDELIINFKNDKVQKKESFQKNNFRYGKVVMIDAGHGGKDSGSLGVGANNKEKDVVLKVALRLGKELKKRGYKVLYTRTKDIFINLRDRTKMANDKKVDLFISIHANAAPNKTKAKKTEGIETFFLSPARSERSKKAAETENIGDFEEMDYFSKQSFLNFLNREKIVASNKLAIDIQKEVLSSIRKKYKIIDGGVREAPFWVLVGAQMPAILLEIGYITHPYEGKRINSKIFQDYLAKGIANGIDSYFYNNR